MPADWYICSLRIVGVATWLIVASGIGINPGTRFEMTVDIPIALCRVRPEEGFFGWRN